MRAHVEFPDRRDGVSIWDDRVLFLYNCLILRPNRTRTIVTDTQLI